MSVIIGADIVPMESNRAVFAVGVMEQLIGTEMNSADYHIIVLTTKKERNS